jgi:hypothetical protein
MNLEDCLSLLETGRNIEWSQEKGVSVLWMYKTNLDGLAQAPTFQEMVEA